MDDEEIIYMPEKSKNNIIKYGVLVSFVLLIIICVQLFFINGDLNNTIIQKDNNINQLNNTIEIKNNSISLLNNTITEKTNNINLLNNTIIQKDNNINELTIKYINVKNQINSTINELTIYENKINESIDWIKNNATLSSSKANIIMNKCVKNNSNMCYIDLYCIMNINTEYFFFSYKETNKFLSLFDYENNYGGDCKSTSLYFKSEINYIINNCYSQSIQMETYQSTQNYFDRYDINDGWEIPYAKNAPTIFNKYPIVVCGYKYDLYGRRVNIPGHCLVAFITKKILSANDISNIENGDLIEPQNGAYFDKISYMSFPDKTNRGLYTWPSYDIEIIISDDDFYILDKGTGKWNYYKYFKENIINLRQSLFEVA